MSPVDIAIVGLSFKLPQGVDTESDLWEVLEQRKNLMTEWPESRLNIKPFYDAETSKLNKLHCTGAHFVKEDPGVFDAPFFAITPSEAAAMDPQQRWALETSYHVFENAGVSLEKIKGSKTAVFTASFSDDYARIAAKDPDAVLRTAVTGTAQSILANRVSWYFDLVGPSLHVDTACSSSLVALDLACQSLQTGDASSALVLGCNVILGPERSVQLSNLNFLSPTSLCHSFDHRADGYARGEGIVGVLLKPVADAVRDGDIIRAVIRSSGTNQDGKTPGLTQPSGESQEALIRHVYSKAGLDYQSTRYVEAHGTGTPVGDPIEMGALGRVFGASRTPQDPLFVGSVKANLGHLEGCSGLAGILKSIMVLERGIIPPNALFEKINPSIDMDSYNAQIPTEPTQWPDHVLRRVSVNSFGFGGTNAHAVLDDAYHYLEECASNSALRAYRPLANGSNKVENHENETAHNGVLDDKPHSIADQTNTRNVNGYHKPSGSDNCSTSTSPNILVWSASDENALQRMIQSYNEWAKTQNLTSPSLDKLASTLFTRRSHLLWRTFSIVDGDVPASGFQTVKAVRSSSKPSAAFVFTGQGAQYAGMGRELTRYPVFQETLEKVDNVYRSLGSTWSLFDELDNPATIDRPEYSQPLSTALQIALVALLQQFAIHPTAVIGHSSGEIAAAYAIGALSLESASKVAFIRGQLAGKLKEKLKSAPGAMMSVNLPASEVLEYFSNKDMSSTFDHVQIACVNSPMNCTLSGDEQAIDELKAQLDDDGIFAAKLKTGVAYHSSAMSVLANEYSNLMGKLEPGNLSGVPMVSSLTGDFIEPSTLSAPQYWVDNLTSQVKFSEGLSRLASSFATSLADILEVGAHSALRRPVLDTLSKATHDATKVRYTSVLNRSKPCTQTFLELCGQYFCFGYNVSLPFQTGRFESQGPNSFLVDGPRYPFDHSNTYWSESRIGRDYRMKEKTTGDLLGTRSADWNPLEPRWRNFLDADDQPWLGDHVVSDTTIYPGMGMVVMAVEAVTEMTLNSNRPVTGYYVKEAHFTSPAVISRSGEKTETMLHLRPIVRQYEKESTWFEAKLFTYRGEQWTECFWCSIQVQYEEGQQNTLDGGVERDLSHAKVEAHYVAAEQSCSKHIDSQSFYTYFKDRGMDYRDYFRVLENIHWDGQGTAIASVDVSTSKHKTANIVHPAILDAAAQVLMVQNSRGLSESTAAFVSYRLFDSWFSASGWQSPETSSLRILTTAEQTTAAHETKRGSIYALGDNGKPVCIVQQMVYKPVSNTGSDASQADDMKMLYGIHWKPQLSMLTGEELGKICSDVVVKEEVPDTELYRLKLENALDCVLRETYKGLSASDLERVPKSLQKYISWMEHHITSNKTGLSAVDANENISNGVNGTSNGVNDTTNGVNGTSPNIEHLLHEIETMNPAWILFPTIARSLRPILLGEVNPLNIAFDTGLAEIFYKDIFDTVCDDRFHKLMELLTHENPNLRILEVGAGTGGFTQQILNCLQSIEEQTGANAFIEYTYTDISPSFFEAAQKKFAGFKGRIMYKTFDLDQDAVDQGFEAGAYDLVIAGSVLHATTSLDRTIGNIRRLFKPDGHLLNLEIIAPEKVVTNFGFGLLPGWWLCNEEWRSLCPGVNEDRWDEILKRNGFSGNDLVLKDYENESCHIFSLLLSRATEPAKEDLALGSNVLLVVDSKSSSQAALSQSLKTGFLETRGYMVKVQSLDETTEDSVKDADFVIAVVECDQSLLIQPSSTEFQFLKDLVSASQKLLWVSCAGSDEHYAERSMMQGLFRSLRSESMEKRIVTLTIEGQSDIDSSLEHIKRVFTESLGGDSQEIEYIARSGLLTTGRIFQKKSLSDGWQSLVFPRSKEEAWQPGPAVQLSVQAPGLLNTLEFIEDERPVLGPTEVEIEAVAWGVSFRDIFVALGRLEGGDLGYDCAGVVSRAGVDSEFSPGDRVCMCSIGCMRSHPRADDRAVYRLPDSLSFQEAASIISPGLTAYYCLVEVARLKKGEKILIHSGSGSTGQLAIWIAKSVGAEVFATVGFEDKKKLLMETFGVPEDHIFYSRNNSFAKGIMRVTKGSGVDVVLNSLSGDALRASWECVAPYGRFIEIGKADIVANSGLPMANFARNISFCAVDLHHVAQSDLNLVSRLLKSTMDLLLKGEIHLPAPLHVYPVSQIEKAFRFLQSGKNTGRIVISIKPTDIVQKLTRQAPSWEFHENSTYLISGGMGGVGRRIIRWMVDRGARNLIVLSRSGGASPAAQGLISELTGRGVRIETPKCDVSSQDSLCRVLAACGETMPPIKGCINASMVLQDAIFDNMTHPQWDLTVASKAATSWNLHQQLPSDLDFFIQLSSLAGIYGSTGQSNYAAGCAFQDALARHRVSQNPPQKAVSIDVGWMRTIGIIAETEAYERQRKSAADMREIEDFELLALLDIYCDPSLPVVSRDDAQVLIGVNTPVDMLAKGLQPPELTMRPLFSGFMHLTGDGESSNEPNAFAEDFGKLFMQAPSQQEKAEIFIAALVRKLGQALSIVPDDIEIVKPLSHYGVDSLVAVELRNWIGREFKATVAVFDIVGKGVSIISIGDLVAQKSQLGTGGK